jgi:hypothetical protein
MMASSDIQMVESPDLDFIFTCLSLQIRTNDKNDGAEAMQLCVCTLI